MKRLSPLLILVFISGCRVPGAMQVKIAKPYHMDRFLPGQTTEVVIKAEGEKIQRVTLHIFQPTDDPDYNGETVLDKEFSPTIDGKVVLRTTVTVPEGDLILTATAFGENWLLSSEDMATTKPMIITGLSSDWFKG